MVLKRRKPIISDCFYSYSSPSPSPLFSPSPYYTNRRSPKKPKGFGFFGTMLKRITNPKKWKKNLGNVSVKDILRLEEDSYSTKGGGIIKEEEDSDDNMEFASSSSRNNSSSSSAASSSCKSGTTDDSDEEDSEFLQQQHSDFKEFSSSSPFRFVLDTSSSGQVTPEFRSPVSSPARLKKQVIKNQQGEPHCTGNSLEEEEEQFSPVSVLEPQFDDEDDEEEEDGQEDDDDYDDDGSEMERSFASVHRARQQLLQKLRRFERLAELDPIELEKRIAEDELNGSDDDEDSEDETVSDNCRGDSLVRQLVVETSLCTIIDGRIPSDMKRLVLDLRTQVESEQESPSDDREMNKLIRNRLDSWKEVESNTIDMMVELDFRSEGDKWRKNKEQVKEIATAIEFDIFSNLIMELSEELVHHQISL